MIIKRHQIYVDAKSIRKIGGLLPGEREALEEELKELRETVIREANERASHILEEARKRAQETLARAKEEADKVVEESKKAYSAELESLKEEKSKLQALLGSIPEKLDSAIKSLADEALPVLKVIYKKVLEKDIDEELARRRLESALSRIFETAGITIRLNPADVERVKDLVVKGANILPDPGLKEGDVLIETRLGILDKSTAFQWKMIEDIIDEVL